MEKRQSLLFLFRKEKLKKGDIFMKPQEIEKIIESLSDKRVFALLIGVTQEGEIVLRPIGGEWDSGIINAIQEMNQKYPNCKMKLLERSYDDWFKYFTHVVQKDRMI
ncbi:hypothetical protein ACAG39_01870 [Caldicellulosiruptoraceae bacterium PP1]